MASSQYFAGINFREQRYDFSDYFTRCCNADTLLREIYIESKGKVMVTLLSDPKAKAINFSLQPRQKNNKKKQKPTTVRSKDEENFYSYVNQATRLSQSNCHRYELSPT